MARLCSRNWYVLRLFVPRDSNLLGAVSNSIHVTCLSIQSQWLSDFLLQSFKSAQNQFPAECFFFVRRQFAIASRVRDAAGGDGPQRADFLGDGDHRADLRHRDFQLFYFFADRCAAASAGASSRREDHAGDSGCF